MTKSFNFSNASRTAQLTVNKALVNKYDEYHTRYIKLSWRYFGVFIIFLSIALKLYAGGHWAWALLPTLIALFAAFRFYTHRNAAGTSAYTSGLLVPAMVASTQPLELLALADVNATENEPPQWAYKHFAVNALPLHQPVVGERIPCVALFGGKVYDRWTNFEPRPLCWATDDAEVLKSNMEAIEEHEWNLLAGIVDDTTAAQNDIILLHIDEQTGVATPKMNKIAYGGVEFCYPDSWRNELEEIGEGSYFLSCEKKGDASQEIVIVTVEKCECTPDQKIEADMNEKAMQGTYKNTVAQPIEKTTVHGANESCCRFTAQVNGSHIVGLLYAMVENEKLITIFMQDTEDDFDRKFAFFNQSFKVV